MYFKNHTEFYILSRMGIRHFFVVLEEKYHTDCLTPKVSENEGSVSLWECIWSEGVEQLVTLKSNINALLYNEVLEKEFMPLYQSLPNVEKGDYIYQEYNMCYHKTNLAERFKKELGLKILEWPSNSSDLDLLDNKIRARRPQPITLRQLENVLQEMWKAISIETCMTFCLNMQNRLFKLKMHKFRPISC
ncbi:hypothetical protein PHYBLDRAFT_70222 [Phycomyces blakesleeanus NRRL 1555(-)]|uniref:Tc1-like transposase DDE domain-containing protein n=1 Tax=Phycomyces blakesleeanus (strain ATCC 8743b / DSM 1359 / FGSC 10004 / NBRC 33097 / NRRL 1555) TaxID=763407 RepID=A0A167JVV4_PHYB8|nr:hypothetical protein PHYBLDRAFT_70222 [Phycomyces blakesleeanus NRRL 1555(-)]OAD66788.1 hypothetical protein PHYBLDRAFT_70222 [Phycomyces blakesleeanus NRRL 1555(-)]|eukprot:XP_018284828.1 hypothetical protein PHYBLDRAFT_70222 [Phycomyces blakesleeanus NRRL 1555(-)]